MRHIVALSGGKDSTAMALRLAEVEPRHYTYICNPTGDELSDMVGHWQNLEYLLGKPLLHVRNGTLHSWIEHFNALPNWRQRWCTRLLKIEPTLAYLKANRPATLYVGLRADEEERKGIYSDTVTSRFPLREWGWAIADVWGYLRDRGIRIPKRTDCARCYGQRLHEWKALWHDHPAVYAHAEAQEQRIGATFRSPGRDSLPASLAELRVIFENGKTFRRDQIDLFDPTEEGCRVCRL